MPYRALDIKISGCDQKDTLWRLEIHSDSPLWKTNQQSSSVLRQYVFVLSALAPP